MRCDCSSSSTSRSPGRSTERSPHDDQRRAARHAEKTLTTEERRKQWLLVLLRHALFLARRRRWSDVEVGPGVLRSRVTVLREKRMNDHEQRAEGFHGRERTRPNVNPP